MADDQQDIDLALEAPGSDEAPEGTGFPDPDEFENFDEVESTTVELPIDLFDEKAANFDEEGCGCAR